MKYSIQKLQFVWGSIIKFPENQREKENLRLSLPFYCCDKKKKHDQFGKDRVNAL